MFIPLAAVVGLSFVTCANPTIGIVLLVIGIAFTYEFSQSNKTFFKKLITS